MSMFQKLVLRALYILVRGMMAQNPTGTQSEWYEAARELNKDITTELVKW